MKSRLASTAFGLFVFTALFVGTYVLFPYIAIHQTYENGQGVSDLFPIAVTENSQVKIVKWPQYREDPGAYSDKLVLPPMNGVVASSNNDRFTLESGGEKEVLLSLYQEDYTFWAQYSVEDSVVKPLNFWFTGAFVIGYCFLVGLAGTPLIGWLLRKIKTHGVKSEA